MQAVNKAPTGAKILKIIKAPSKFSIVVNIASSEYLTVQDMFMTEATPQRLMLHEGI